MQVRDGSGRRNITLGTMKRSNFRNLSHSMFSCPCNYLRLKEASVLSCWMMANSGGYSFL